MQYIFNAIYFLLYCTIIDKVYIGDNTNNDLVRELKTLTSDIISSIVGTGASTYSGDDGHATSAGLSSPNGIALDSTGRNFYVTPYFMYYPYFYRNPFRKHIYR